MWSDVIRAPVWCIWAVTGIPSQSPQKTGAQKSPGIALSNGFSESCTYRDQNVSYHQSVEGLKIVILGLIVMGAKRDAGR